MSGTEPLPEEGSSVVHSCCNDTGYTTAMTGEIMTNEQLVNLISQLTTERNELIEAANRQIAYVEGKIAMLQELLQSQETVSNEPDTES